MDRQGKEAMAEIREKITSIEKKVDKIEEKKEDNSMVKDMKFDPDE